MKLQQSKDTFGFTLGYHTLYLLEDGNDSYRDDLAYLVSYYLRIALDLKKSRNVFRCLHVSLVFTFQNSAGDLQTFTREVGYGIEFINGNGFSRVLNEVLRQISSSFGVWNGVFLLWRNR